MHKYVQIANMKVIVFTMNGLTDVLVEDWKVNKKSGFKASPKLVFSANGQGVSMYSSSPSFKKNADKADIIHADGMSVVTASKIFTKTTLPERIATTDFFHHAAKSAEKEGLKFFIFGGKEQANKIAVEEIQKLYPKLKIVGRRNGYFSASEENSVIAEINKAKPDVLWVGLGRPKQEEWSVNNKEKLIGVTWIKTCGGLFDYFDPAKKASRAPQWVQSFGLEWLYRTIREPRRLFWRYLTTNIHSMYLMARYSKDIND